MLEVRCLGEWDVFHWRDLAGLMAAIREGTVCGQHADVGHFGGGAITTAVVVAAAATFIRVPGASIANLFLIPPFLVRHKSGEFEGVLGPPAGGGLAGHPAGV